MSALRSPLIPVLALLLSPLVALAEQSTATPVGATQYRPTVDYEAMFEAQKQYEMNLYSALPNRIDCEQQTYLENCEDINFLLKKHPDAPMRIPTAQGDEVVIKPDAPAPLVNFILNQSPEGARETVEWWRGQFRRFNRMEQMIVAEGYRQGGIMNGGPDGSPRTSFEEQTIGTGEGVEITMITQSTCPACQYQLNVMDRVTAMYPDISLRVFQVDQDEEYFQRTILDQGYGGRVMTPAEVNSLNITGWPYTQVKSTVTNRHENFYGTKSIPSYRSVLTQVMMTEESNDE